MQARSTASVAAILEATLQVLRAVGKERLTTTRVAARAGVSVGTLYQYFPNKSALLQAALKSHLDAVWHQVEAACLAHHGTTLDSSITAVIEAFLDAKMKRPRISAALYAVSADVDGARIGRAMGAQAIRSIADLLRSAPTPPHADPHLVATMLYGTMVGTSRILLESPDPAALLPSLRHELTCLARAYVTASAVPPATSRTPAAKS